MLWECFLKASAVTLAVWMISLLLRRRSAALRHSLWLCALAAFLLDPGLIPLARRIPAVRVPMALDHAAAPFPCRHSAAHAPAHRFSKVELGSYPAHSLVDRLLRPLRPPGNREVTRTDESGDWTLSGIPAGNYTVEVRARGFAVATRTIVQTSGQRAAMEQHLKLGDVQETIDVVTQGQARRTSGQAVSSAQPIPVGGNVQATRLLKQVKPVYPESAQAQGIEGTVLLKAVIGKDGDLLSLTVMNKLADPDLAAAALDAVKAMALPADPAQRLSGRGHHHYHRKLQVTNVTGSFPPRVTDHGSYPPAPGSDYLSFIVGK